MGHELRQRNIGAVSGASFVDDQSGNNSLHMQANARIVASLNGQISQTSPGVITGTGGNTSMSLPSGAVPIGISFYSNLQASTGATISVGIDTTSGYFLNAQSVATLALGKGQQIPVGATNLYAALAALPLGQAHTVTGFYAETATSGSGGPFFVSIDYYVPDPA